MDSLLAIQEKTEFLMEGVLGLLRILWREHIARPTVNKGLRAGPKLAKKLAEECKNVPEEIRENILESWLKTCASSENKSRPITFENLCYWLFPNSVYADLCYFAMRSIRQRYNVKLSSGTAAAAHNLTQALAKLLDKAPGREVSLEELNRAMKERPRSPKEKKAERLAEAGVREAFIEVSLCLDLFEFRPDSMKLTFRPQATDAEYMMSHLFGIPTAIHGFDVLFGGGGLMLSDAITHTRSEIEPPPDEMFGIGGRSVLCIGPFGSGKTLLTLQFAVEIARKGGIAVVMPLEQTKEECLYALEAVGVSTTQSSFIIVDDVKESFRALTDPAPSKGALVFLRPIAGEQSEYREFLKGVEGRLTWMSQYPLRLLVIDPINALVPGAGDRRATRELFEKAKKKGVNVWFTSEQISQDSEYSHFAENIADTVIHVGTQTILGQQKRYIEITKSRFQQEASGRHGLAIESEGGIYIHPSSALVARSSALMARHLAALPAQKEIDIPFGVPGIERLLGPEPIKPSDIIALAGPGKAKTLVGLKFMVATLAVEAATDCALFISDYSPTQVDRLVSIVRDPEDQQPLRIEQCTLSTGYVDPGRILDEIRDAFDHCHRKGWRVRRVLLANLARWEQEMPFLGEDHAFGIALITLLRSHRAAAVIICGDTMERGSWLRDTVFDQADTLLQFRRTELQGRVTTLISVVKTRAMQHQRELFELSLDISGVQVRPAPLVRLKPSGDMEQVKISLFLHAETANHSRYNDRLIEALRATLSPKADLEGKQRRFDPSLLSMSQFSAVDELQIFQLDEFQLPTGPAAVFPPRTLYSFDSRLNSTTLKGRLPEFTGPRVMCENGNSFLAIPFYANLSFFAVDRQKLDAINQKMGFQEFPKTWEELAYKCRRWDQEEPESNDLLFSCAIYKNGIETYNCLFFEILYSLYPPPETEAVNPATWLSTSEALHAGYILWLLCRRSHKIRSKNKPYIAASAICRHWYNTLNQELSNMTPGQRSQIRVEPLFHNRSTAGEWYLAIPSHSASPEVGLRLIEQLTSLDRETLRVELGVGLPTRTAYYQASETSETSVSRYFHFPRLEVYQLLQKAIRRSNFSQYQRSSNTISSHLQWILEIPAEPKDGVSDNSVRAEIERAMKSLASNLRFLTQNDTAAKSHHFS
jgi:KaiC/GvpD/RAD55 family RecA-like ATPase